MSIVTVPIYKFLTNAPLIKKIRAFENEQLSIMIATPKVWVTPVMRIHFFWMGQNFFNDKYGTAVEVLNNRFTINVSASFSAFDFNTVFDVITKLEVWAEIASNRRTEIRTFIPDNSPQPNDIIRIIWLNLKGGYDAYTFTCAQKHVTEAEKVRFTKQVNFPFNLSDSGVSVASASGSDVFEIFSDYETPETLKWLAELILSPKVFWIKNGQKLPIDIITKSHEHRNFSDLLQMKLQFAMANDKIIQNG